MEELEILKQKENFEIEYPFKENDRYWFIGTGGHVNTFIWTTNNYDSENYDQGHIFKTKQEAERERDRRALLTRFRQFRDKCNGDWKPAMDERKYYIFLKNKHFSIASSMIYDYFNLFGYFKNKKDAERAIELFGDEIKRLWVDE